MFGIIWLGHLYFFNLVNVPFQGDLDKELKPKVNPKLLLRAFWWFRWSAMYTFLIGLALFVWHYIYPENAMRSPDGQMTGRAMWIEFGMLLGIVMWFNVWFVIWPAQKQILGGLLGANPPAPPEVPKKALLFSRINTWLSAPMLMCMIAASHIGDWSSIPRSLRVLFVLLALGAIHGMLKLAPKKGTGL